MGDDFLFDFGDEVQDITGFKGIVTARSEYFNGCRRYCLEKTDDEKGMKDWWFDEGRLHLVQAGKVKPARANADIPSALPGG